MIRREKGDGAHPGRFTDRNGAAPVAIIDERAARQFWPDADPLGEYLGRPWLKERIPIVGVVGSVRNQSLFGDEHPAIYLPFSQSSNVEARLVLQTALSPEDLAGTLRAVVAELDPEAPVSRIHTNREAIEATLGQPGLAALLLSGFSFLALMLGGIGIYGNLAYSVRQRSAEIGVRLALGASSEDVTRLVLKEGFWMSGVGLAGGLLAALGLAPLLQGFLFGVRGHDPMSLLQGVALLGLVSLSAAYVPVRRALKLNPVEALRQH